HFATWRQLLLDRCWDYGASRPGPEDMMSFQIGWPHWWLVIAAMIAGGWWLWKKQLQSWLLWGYLGAVFMGSVWLMHAKSVIFWELFSFVAVTQFPWRLLAITNLAVALLVGLAVAKMEKVKLKQWVVVGVLGL